MSQLNRSLSVSRRHAVIGAENPTRIHPDPSGNEESVVLVAEREEEILEEERYVEWLKEMRGWLLVVAVLIATCAYTTSISPPGGYWQDDNERHTAGTSILADKTPARYTIFRLFNSIALAQSFAIIVIIMSKASYFKGGKSLVRALQLLTIGSIAAVSVAHATIDVVYYYFKINVPYLVIIFLILTEIISWLQPHFSDFKKFVKKISSWIMDLLTGERERRRSSLLIHILHVVLRLGVIVGLLMLSYKDSRTNKMWGNPGYKVGLAILSAIGVLLWWIGR